jgi:hypothetical protein
MPGHIWRIAIFYPIHMDRLYRGGRCQMNGNKYINSIVPYNIKVNHMAEVNVNKIVFYKKKQNILFCVWVLLKYILMRKSKGRVNSKFSLSILWPVCFSLKNWLCLYAAIQHNNDFDASHMKHESREYQHAIGDKNIFFSFFC